MKVYVGCSAPSIIEKITKSLDIDDVRYFVPKIEDRTYEDILIERDERSNSDVVLYVITNEMDHIYNIADAIDNTHKNPSSTHFYVVSDGFTKEQIRSLVETAHLIQMIGGRAVVQSDLNYLVKGKFITITKD